MGITLCDESDIKARLQLGPSDALTDVQQKAWPGLAEEATALVEGFLGREWDVDTDADDDDPTPQTAADVLATVPTAVRVVVSRMTVRAMTGASGAGGGATPMDGQQSASSTFGPMSYARGFSTEVFTSPWMSKSDRATLRRYVVRGQVQHVPMFNDSYNRTPFSFRQRLGHRWPWGWWGP